VGDKDHPEKRKFLANPGIVLAMAARVFSVVRGQLSKCVRKKVATDNLTN